MYVSVCGGTRASDRARMYSFVTLVYVVPIDAFGEAPLLAAPENPLLVSGGETDEKAENAPSLKKQGLSSRPRLINDRRPHCAPIGGRVGAAACEARRFPRPRRGCDVVEDRKATGTRLFTLSRSTLPHASSHRLRPTADRRVANPVGGAPFTVGHGLPRGSTHDGSLRRASDDTANASPLD